MYRKKKVPRVFWRKKPQAGLAPAPITGQPFGDDDPLFTVICVDYEPSVPREVFRRKMACLAAQTCKDFEVLVYHDGPKAQSYEADLAGEPSHPATQFFVTPSRVGDWGHSNRDLGIRAARGRWIIHTNADNVFYPQLIATLKAALTAPESWVFAYWAPRRYPAALRRWGNWLDRQLDLAPAPRLRLILSDDPQILVYGIIMQGMVPIVGNEIRARPVAGRQGLIMGGVPTQYGRCDCMQLVMKRELWLAEGGWYNRAMDSDGHMYPQFARKYRVLAVPQILGEHW
jgi:hypothetical protein